MNVSLLVLGLLCGNPSSAPSPEEKLPLTGLPPAKVTPGLCLLSYRVGTESKECQALFDQGLAYLYSKKGQVAAQAFETATRHDPDCPMVWWGLSRALERWGKDAHKQALAKAQALMARGSDRERLLITARLQEKGALTGGRAAAAKTLDELLTIDDEDEEGWYNRAQLVEAGSAQVPYLKALLRLNPLHPGASLDLVHFYESDKRSLLKQYHTDSYNWSSPGISQGKPATTPGLPGARQADPNAKLPITGLAPAKITPNLCLLSYRISTRSPECQAHFDQGLGYFYSYVYMEAARSFETAARYDPDCPIVWWGLSRALEKQSRAGNQSQALQKAQDLLPRATLRERLLITSRLQEKGKLTGGKSAAIRTLEDLITLYEDDEEAWYARALLADNGVQRVVLYKALLRINPLHAGATHELVHFYETFRRPALGWIYAENYIRSSPGIPHALHMQAHLATRIGKWDKTSDRSARAVELERAYHKEMNVSPRQDDQYGHHLDTLMMGLVHDGRFKEARAIKAEAQANGYRHNMPWFRLHLAERDWAEALKIAEQMRRGDAGTASYMAALVYLHKGDAAKVAAEIETLKKGGGGGRPGGNRRPEARVWETEGWLKCQKGDVDGGLKLLQQAVDRTKNDYGHHAWGNGALYMETWGIAALQAGRADVAEEAFLEALAHDPGCVRAALGLQVLCERQKRTEEMARFADVARRYWKKADPGCLEKELAWMRTLGAANAAQDTTGTKLEGQR